MRRTQKCFFGTAKRTAYWFNENGRWW